MKVQIILPMIERWHCIDLMLANLRLANRPQDCSVLCVLTSGDEYFNYIKPKLEEIFENVQFVRKEGVGVEHSELRTRYYESNVPHDGEDIRMTKLKAVYDTYQKVVENIDRSVDYYWFIEDDTLFQIDIFDRYMQYMETLDADIVSGVSYYWHTESNHCRNFWSIKPKGDTIELTPIPHQNHGVVYLGATGLGNVLAKKKAVTTWSPETYAEIGSGADISFFYNAMRKGLMAYGIWDIFLPHITKHTNGDIEIRGRIDRSLRELICRN